MKLSLSYEEREERQREIVREFAQELLNSPENLEKVIPMVCEFPAEERKGQRRMTPLFGKIVAQESENPLELLEKIKATSQSIEDP